jgi:hypothetical protein
MEVHILCCLFAVFFFPLLPAFLLYKSLPSKASVRGPFKGLKINLGGAFAGYFLLVLIASYFVRQSLAPKKPRYEVWRITGQIKAESTDPNTNEESGYIKDTKVSAIPPNLKVGSNGRFMMKIIVDPGLVEGEREFPALMFNLPEYIGQPKLLDETDSSIVFSEKAKLINLTQPVFLERLPEKTEEAEWNR